MAWAWAEAATIAALTVFYLVSFGRIASPVHGPLEIFAQDSVYLLESLAAGVTYPWNPQNHFLHHIVVEMFYVPWKAAFGPGLASAFHYLKWVSALSGLAFLLVFRRVLVELGVADAARRIALLLLTGLSVSMWFHFAAFETHGLALPALAAYLLCLIRLRDRDTRTALDRWMFVGALAWLGAVRIDLLRFAAVSALLPLLPLTRRWWRGLVVDLALVAALVMAGGTLAAMTYLHEPIDEAVGSLLYRDDRVELEGRLQTTRNLSPGPLTQVGRAVVWYGMLMPVERRPAGRGFFTMPDYRLTLTWKEGEERPSTGLFRESLRNLFGYPVSAAALVAVTALLALGVGSSVLRAIGGDLLHALLLAQALFGWLLYTWFNPLEPFLWVLEFVPLWIVMIAEALRDRGRSMTIGVGIVTALLALHNLFAFYRPFR